LDRSHAETVAERNGSFLFGQWATFAAQTGINRQQSRAIIALGRREFSAL
jgi:hypothetical protein